MDTALLVAVSAGVVGLALLVGIAHNTQPTSVALTDVAAHEGRLVHVEGRVGALQTLSGEAVRLTLVEGNHSLWVFVRQPVPVLAGDNVEATGRVAIYRGTWEVVVDDAAAVMVRQGWDDAVVPVPRLAAAPWHFVDTHVRTRGILEETPSGPVFLREASATARIRLVDAPPDEVHGQPIDVWGRVEYDPKWNVLRLRVMSTSPAEA